MEPRSKEGALGHRGQPLSERIMLAIMVLLGAAIVVVALVLGVAPGLLTDRYRSAPWTPPAPVTSTSSVDIASLLTTGFNGEGDLHNADIKLDDEYNSENYPLGLPRPDRSWPIEPNGQGPELIGFQLDGNTLYKKANGDLILVNQQGEIIHITSATPATGR